MNKKVKVSLSSYQSTESGVEEIKVSAPGTYSQITDRQFRQYEEKTAERAINMV